MLLCSYVGMCTIGSNQFCGRNWWHSRFMHIYLMDGSLRINVTPTLVGIRGCCPLAGFHCLLLWLFLVLMQLSYVKGNLEEMEYILTANESSLTESLLPSRHSFFIRETRWWEVSPHLLLFFYNGCIRASLCAHLLITLKSTRFLCFGKHNNFLPSAKLNFML